LPWSLGASLGASLGCEGALEDGCLTGLPWVGVLLEGLPCVERRGGLQLLDCRAGDLHLSLGLSGLLARESAETASDCQSGHEQADCLPGSSAALPGCFSLKGVGLGGVSGLSFWGRPVAPRAEWASLLVWVGVAGGGFSAPLGSELGKLMGMLGKLRLGPRMVSVLSSGLWIVLRI
jgi:hypothetical protein